MTLETRSIESKETELDLAQSRLDIRLSDRTQSAQPWVILAHLTIKAMPTFYYHLLFQSGRCWIDWSTGTKLMHQYLRFRYPMIMCLETGRTQMTQIQHHAHSRPSSSPKYKPLQTNKPSAHQPMVSIDNRSSGRSCRSFPFSFEERKSSDFGINFHCSVLCWCEEMREWDEHQTFNLVPKQVIVYFSVRYYGWATPGLTGLPLVDVSLGQTLP